MVGASLKQICTWDAKNNRQVSAVCRWTYGRKLGLEEKPGVVGVEGFLVTSVGELGQGELNAKGSESESQGVDE